MVTSLRLTRRSGPHWKPTRGLGKTMSGNVASVSDEEDLVPPRPHVLRVLPPDGPVHGPGRSTALRLPLRPGLCGIRIARMVGNAFRRLIILRRQIAIRQSPSSHELRLRRRGRSGGRGVAQRDRQPGCGNPTIAELERMRDVLSPNATGSIWGDAISIASERIIQSALTYTEACEGDPSLWPPIPAVEMGRSLER